MPGRPRSALARCRGSDSAKFGGAVLHVQRAHWAAAAPAHGHVRRCLACSHLREPHSCSASTHQRQGLALGAATAAHWRGARPALRQTPRDRSLTPRPPARARHPPAPRDPGAARSAEHGAQRGGGRLQVVRARARRQRRQRERGRLRIRNRAGGVRQQPARQRARGLGAHSLRASGGRASAPAAARPRCQPDSSRARCPLVLASVARCFGAHALPYPYPTAWQQAVPGQQARLTAQHQGSTCSSAASAEGRSCGAGAAVAALRHSASASHKRARAEAGATSESPRSTAAYAACRARQLGLALMLKSVPGVPGP